MKHLPTDVGPYETEQQAADTVSHIYTHARTAPGTMGRLSLDQLTAACEAAGVELGAYDLRILRWLSGWEPETCAVIAGLIARAGGGPVTRDRGGDGEGAQIVRTPGGLTPEVRELLTLIRDALDLPYGATGEDSRKRAELARTRMICTVATLSFGLDEPDATGEEMTRWLKANLDGYPIDYAVEDPEVNR